MDLNKVTKAPQEDPVGDRTGTRPAPELHKVQNTNRGHSPPSTDELVLLRYLQVFIV